MRATSSEREGEAAPGGACLSASNVASATLAGGIADTLLASGSETRERVASRTGGGAAVPQEDAADDALGGAAVLERAEALPERGAGRRVVRARGQGRDHLVLGPGDDPGRLAEQVEVRAADRAVDLPVRGVDHDRAVQDRVVEHDRRVVG